MDRIVRTRVRGFKSEEQLRNAISELYDAWCERRSLGALAALLPARNCWLGTTEGWHELLGHLEDVRSLREAEITEEEHALIEDLILAVEKAINKK